MLLGVTDGEDTDQMLLFTGVTLVVGSTGDMPNAPLHAGGSIEV